MSMYSAFCIRVTNFSGMGGEFGLNMKGPADPLIPATCGIAGAVPVADSGVLASIVGHVELPLLVESAPVY